MKKLLFIILSVILVSGVMLCSCGEEAEELTKPPEGGKEGGWLILPVSSEISNIGHTAEISNPGDAGYSFVCTEGLLYIDEDGNLEPFLAESWKIADDGSYVDFKLREGIDFTDGVPFNAEAVKINVDIQLEQKVWTNLWPFESCEIIDDYYVRMNFDDDRYDWGAVTSLATFFSCKMFSPEHLAQSDEWKRSHVVGTGPFILDEYVRGQYIKYVRNDNYWRGKPYLDGIELRILPQAETQLLAFKAGEVHSVGIQAKDAADMIAEGYEIEVSYDFVFNGGLMFSAGRDNPDSPWADVRVRRAAAHAVDIDSLIEGLTYGYGKPSNQVFIEAQTMWYNPDVVGYEYDPDKSRQLLTEAGYPKGFKTTWHMLDFMNLDMPTAVQDMLREVGIDVEFELVSMPVFNSMVASGWEGIVWGGVFAGSAMEPSGQFVNGVLNGRTTWVGAIQPDELYEMALEANSSFDVERRQELYRYIAKSLTDDYCQIAYLPYMPAISCLSPKVKGARFGTTLYAYTFAWLEE